MAKAKSNSIDIPKTLTEMAATKIRDMIINGQFEFGEQLTESRLSEMFGISKTPIREALLSLSREHLIEVKPRRGTFIFSLTEKEINNITNIRILLEHSAIRSAIDSNASQLFMDLNKNIETSKKLFKKMDLTSYRQLDHDFHYVFLKYADNPDLSELYRLTSAKIQSMRNRLTFSQHYVENSIEEHCEIVQMLQDNNLDRACLLVAKHIKSGFTERTRRLLADSAHCKAGQIK